VPSAPHADTLPMIPTQISPQFFSFLVPFQQELYDQKEQEQQAWYPMYHLKQGGCIQEQEKFP